MPEDQSGRHHRFATRLSHAGRAGTKVHGFVNPPVYRGSTMLHTDCADRIAFGAKRLEQAEVYGVMGNATHHALENVIAEIEGGTRCQIVSSGLAAVTTPLLSYLKSGEHCLMPDSVYGPARAFANGMLRHLGIETTFYDPVIDAAGLEALMRPNTTVLYLESPGSHTFEVQDVPALAEVAHRRGAKVLMDNTWGIHHFQPFRHGVDVSIQALTKYPVGHSDVLLGAVTVATPQDWERVRLGALALGQYASPDDCWLCLRGLRTMNVRLQHQMKSALEVAAWLQGRPEVRTVLYPALPGAPGHEIWNRDFTGACSLFGVVFQPEFTSEATQAMIDSLQLFGIGASWGGFESLALPTTGFLTRTAGSGEFGGPVVRLHIGLEDPADLIADLDQAIAFMRRYPAAKAEMEQVSGA
ncbi:MAG: cystathionine beta-lyase [Acetobacteraceae bacterium]|nr:cystathionine beta-lyase [Acetobacteraceae bacterium]